MLDTQLRDKVTSLPIHLLHLIDPFVCSLVRPQKATIPSLSSHHLPFQRVVFYCDVKQELTALFLSSVCARVQRYTHSPNRIAARRRCSALLLFSL